MILLTPPALRASDAPYVKTEIRSLGLVANLYQPAGKGPHPAVLLLGGSGGGIGWQDATADTLARQGFAAMALAYAGKDDLATEIERIPLEYVQHAVEVLRIQPFVDRKHIAVVGVSKGAELALLLASMTPELNGVVAFAPSAYVWQSTTETTKDTSSWTYRGKDVPFLRYGTVAERTTIAAYYEAGVAQAGDALAAAAIPVERIRGPILLLSGREDNLWPSTAFGDAVVARLKANGFAHRYEHVAYPDAGHLISSVRAEDVSRRGGTEAGNKAAQLDAQKRMIAFLKGWAAQK